MEHVFTNQAGCDEFELAYDHDAAGVRHMRMRHVAQSRGLLHNHGLFRFAVADAAGAERADAGGHNRLHPNALASERSSVASADEAFSDDDQDSDAGSEGVS